MGKSIDMNAPVSVAYFTNVNSYYVLLLAVNSREWKPCLRENDLPPVIQLANVVNVFLKIKSLKKKKNVVNVSQVELQWGAPSDALLMAFCRNRFNCVSIPSINFCT